jgi:hypothetical protein
MLNTIKIPFLVIVEVLVWLGDFRLKPEWSGEQRFSRFLGNNVFPVSRPP